MANNRCLGTLGSGRRLNALCHLARKPTRSRPRKCAISPSTVAPGNFILAVRCLLCIASSCLLRISVADDAVRATAFARLRHQVETELLADNPGEEAAH